jgi:uncharacterized 2Fe-2S/4Fe-4S cluster protein (DUF4445 family)
VICKPNRTYAEALIGDKASVPMDCGSMGTCGKCRIRFLSPAPEASSAGVRLLSAEQLSAGWRLACQQLVEADAVIEIPTSEDQLRATATDTAALRAESLCPGVEQFSVILEPPMGGSSASSEQALSRALGEGCRCSLDALHALSERPRGRRSAFIGVRRGDQILDLRPGSVPGEVLGLAIDVGTTTLAVYLFDLLHGTMRAREVDFNPQRAAGADVISRIGYVRAHAQVGLQRLQQAVVDGLNDLIRRACASADVATSDIYRIVIAGNPTMLHLLAGISPVGIDHNPYTAVFLNSLTVASHDIGLEAHPAAGVLLLPGISSYVGADIVAGLLATSLGRGGRTELLVDVGTNGEIVLATDGRFIACSTAAGPAFEGAEIRDGMNAVPGAIEDLVIDADSVQCTTIGGLPPKGICGTGLISAVHELLKVGIIDATGKLTRGQGALSERSLGEGKDACFVLGDSDSPVAIYQQDIRAFQLGKAAIRVGIDTLLHVAGVAAEDLDRVYVAGAFGTHLLPERALGTGLLPMINKERIHAVGNTSGQGAAIVLLDERLRAAADALAQRVEFIELGSTAEFADRYIDQMAFAEV